MGEHRPVEAESNSDDRSGRSDDAAARRPAAPRGGAGRVPADPGTPSRERDLTQLLDPAAWEERVREARARRERALAVRADGRTAASGAAAPRPDVPRDGANAGRHAIETASGERVSSLVAATGHRPDAASDASEDARAGQGGDARSGAAWSPPVDPDLRTSEAGEPAARPSSAAAVPRGTPQRTSRVGPLPAGTRRGAADPEGRVHAAAIERPDDVPRPAALPASPDTPPDDARGEGLPAARVGTSTLSAARGGLSTGDRQASEASPRATRDRIAGGVTAPRAVPLAFPPELAPATHAPFARLAEIQARRPGGRRTDRTAEPAAVPARRARWTPLRLASVFGAGLGIGIVAALVLPGSGLRDVVAVAALQAPAPGEPGAASPLAPDAAGAETDAEGSGRAAADGAATDPAADGAATDPAADGAGTDRAAADGSGGIPAADGPGGRAEDVLRSALAALPLATIDTRGPVARPSGLAQQATPRPGADDAAPGESVPVEATPATAPGEPTEADADAIAVLERVLAGAPGEPPRTLAEPPPAPAPAAASPADAPESAAAGTTAEPAAEGTGPEPLPGGGSEEAAGETPEAAAGGKSDARQSEAASAEETDTAAAGDAAAGEDAAAAQNLAAEAEAEAELAAAPLRLFLHYPAGLDQPALDQTSGALSAAGLAIGQEVRVGFAVGRTHVRYYHAADAAAARRVAAMVPAAAGGPAELRDFTHFSPAPLSGTVEVWLAGAPPSASASPPASAPPAQQPPAEPTARAAAAPQQQRSAPPARTARGAPQNPIDAAARDLERLINRSGIGPLVDEVRRSIDPAYRGNRQDR